MTIKTTQISQDNKIGIDKQKKNLWAARSVIEKSAFLRSGTECKHRVLGFSVQVNVFNIFCFFTDHEMNPGNSWK